MNLNHGVFHSPGPNWQTGVRFQEQPEVMEHIQHYAKLHEQGKLLYGGSFTDIESGGMMITATSRRSKPGYRSTSATTQASPRNHSTPSQPSVVLSVMYWIGTQLITTSCSATATASRTSSIKSVPGVSSKSADVTPCPRSYPDRATCLPTNPHPRVIRTRMISS